MFPSMPHAVVLLKVLARQHQIIILLKPTLSYHQQGPLLSNNKFTKNNQDVDPTFVVLYYIIRIKTPFLGGSELNWCLEYTFNQVVLHFLCMEQCHLIDDRM